MIPPTDKPPGGRGKKSPSFEQAIEELESIIDRIESGEVGLEQALTSYERGMKLVGRCRTILDTAEKRIAKLTADATGKLTIEDESDDPPV